MAHVFAGTLQEPRRIRKLGTTEEPHIDVGGERIDVAKCRVRDARGRVAVMQQLPNIISTLAHDVKPMPRDSPQLTPMLTHPDLNRRVMFDRAGEAQKPAHGDFI